MSGERDPSDLMAAVRRRSLSPAERAELEKLVQRSPEERMLHYAGFAFDRDSSARPGDDVLIQRIAARASATAQMVPARALPRARRRPRLLLLAAVLGVAGTSVAGTVLYVASTRSIAPPIPPAEPAHSASVVVLPVAARSAPMRSAETSIDAPAPPAIDVARAARRDAPPAAKVAGAAALFEAANRSRLSGDAPRAIVLYQELVQRHPVSAEAALAQLSLGKLLLARGDAERALSAFRAGAAQRSALSAEALWEEAGALRALGREKEERAALERLLARFPNGVYAGAARKRLGSASP